MAKRCPLTGDVVLYLECVECEEKECRTMEETAQKKEDKEVDEKGIKPIV